MKNAKNTKTVVDEIHDMQKSKRKGVFGNSAPVLVAKGLWLFAEGTAQLSLALFAIYQAHYGNYPLWGKYGLTVAGVLVLVPAALLLARFFRQAAKD